MRLNLLFIQCEYPIPADQTLQSQNAMRPTHHADHHQAYCQGPLQHGPGTNRCLNHTWQLLSGKQRSFVPVDRHDFAPLRHCVVLPVQVDERSPAGGVLLTMNEVDARALATAMFGCSEASLSPDDIDDACRELCDQLTNCVTQACFRGAVLRHGPPRTVAHTTLNEMLSAPGVMNLFESHHGGCHTQVAFLDQFVGSQSDNSP